MTGTADIELGYEAYGARSWNQAYNLLSTAAREGSLDARGLEYLGNAAYLTARDQEAAQLWARAFNALVDCGDIKRAARVGFVLSLTSLLRGDASISGGWIARTQRLLQAAPERHVEAGFCRIVSGLRESHGGDPKVALRNFDDALELAVEHQDPDLLALSLLSRGEALIASGRHGEGTACMDEAMISVTGGTVAPIFSGIIYCAVILACQRVFDAERSREWTLAFNSWCEPQPDLVPFRGQCLIHRSEIQQMRGDWHGALAEAERACEWLAGKSGATVGRAHYQKGELHRLFGNFDLAEHSYREAAHHGVDPQPGYALLRLGAGQQKAAVAAIRTACGPRCGADAFAGDPGRLRLLGPSVEIFLSAGETEAAIAAADELAAGARVLRMPLLEATSGTANGAVLAYTDRLEDALALLKPALATWRRIGMPYEAARTQARLAETCHRLGDPDSARMHGEAALSTLRDLGASVDLLSIERAPWHLPKGRDALLTGRQMEVLRLLSDGRSNREIAAELGLSEHTVARHVSNIFDRTGVSSRTAAVAFAHRKGLLG